MLKMRWVAVGFFLIGIAQAIFLHNYLAAIHAQLCAMMFMYMVVEYIKDMK